MKMAVTLSLLLSSLITVNAFAAIDQYGKLEELFATGSIPADSGIAGWYSGRCYLDSARDKALGNILVIMEKALEGPLFGHELKFFGLPSAKVDTWDELSSDEIDEVASRSSKAWRYLTPSYVKDVSYFQDYKQEYGLTSIWLRKNQDYFVAKVEEQVSGKSYNAYCYYFKKVH